MRSIERRTWYILTNSLLGLWMVGAAVIVGVHRFIPMSIWLMVHMALLGAVSTAIIIWSQHFADTLTRRQAVGGRVSLGIRLLAHTLGAITVVVGMLTGAMPVILAGAIVVAAAAVAHAVLMTLQMRGALTSRFGPLVRFYAVAGLWLVVGVGFGFWMSQLSSGSALHQRLFIAHVTVNLLGWVGTTVIGTIVLFWPTVLHARMRPGDGRWSSRVLVGTALGILVAVAGALAGQPALVAAGIVVWLVALGVVVFQGVRQVRDASQEAAFGYAALSIGAAVLWLAASVVTFAVGTLTAGDMTVAVDRLTWLVQPLAAGFAVQIVLGALSYLLPVIMGRPNARKAAERELNRGGIFRAVIVNAGIVAYLLDVPSTVRVIISIVVFAAFVSVPILGIRAVIRGVRERRAESAPATHSPGERLSVGRAQPKKPQRPALSGQIVTAACVILLAFAGGVAADPAASGIDTVAGGEVAATGETTTIDVHVKGMRFVPSTLEVPAGDELVVNFTNTGEDVHDITFANGVSSKRLAPGDSETVDVGVISQSMQAWCSVTGHRAMGMEADVVAVDDDGKKIDAQTGDGQGSDGTDAGDTDAGDTGSSQHEHSGGTGDSAASDLDFSRTPEDGFEPYDPELEPASGGTVHEKTFTVDDTESDVAPGVSQTLWTFNETAPGPVLRGKVGDSFHITLKNEGTMGHSIDFHAGALAPDKPMRTIQPGESLEYDFTATRAGIWMYHCSTDPMSAHIANGMFGAVIIDPPDLPEVDHEFVLVQSEFYLGAQGGEVDASRVGSEDPDIVAFNGYANQYRDRPIDVKADESVRVWVLDAGPNVSSSFHVIGTQFDTVFREGDYTLKDGGSTGVGGSQALDLAPAQGGFVEFSLPEPGHYPFVSHIMSDAEKGAKGIFRVTG